MLFAQRSVHWLPVEHVAHAAFVHFRLRTHDTIHGPFSVIHSPESMLAIWAVASTHSSSMVVSISGTPLFDILVVAAGDVGRWQCKHNNKKRTAVLCDVTQIPKWRRLAEGMVRCLALVPTPLFFRTSDQSKSKRAHTSHVKTSKLSESMKMTTMSNHTYKSGFPYLRKHFIYFLSYIHLYIITFNPLRHT